MTAFWKNLQRLALGQLFNGGYLRADYETPDARTSQPTPATRNAGAGDRNCTLPGGQVAVCQ